MTTYPPDAETGKRKHGPKIGNRQMKMTQTRRQTFLSVLRESGGNFAHAARMATPHSKATRTAPGYSSFKTLYNRDLAFAGQVDQIMTVVAEDIEAELHRRAVVGVLEPVYQKGQRVMDTDAEGQPVKASIRRFSDVLLLARARAVLPAYRDKSQVDVVHSGRVTHAALTMADLQHLSPAELDQVEATFQLLDKAKHGQAAIEHNPGVVLDAEYTEIEDTEDTMAELVRIEQEEAQ